MPDQNGDAPPPKRVTVALVNDYELVVRGVAAMLRPFGDRIDVVELDIAQNPDCRVDVALFDPYGNVRLGLDRVASLAHDPKAGRVAVYTWTLTGEQRAAALAAGAHGIIAKSTPPDDLVDALFEIAAGGEFVSSEFGIDDGPPWPGHDFGLTLRESEVAALLADGLSNKDIAVALWISENTVKTHLKAIFQKTGVASRTQAIARIASGPEFARRRIA
jgi:two-component system, NarL family, response regulator LiaR